jgi:hypothetical protein
MTEHNHRRDSKPRKLPTENRKIRSKGGDMRGWLFMHDNPTTGRDYSFSGASDFTKLSNKLICAKSIGNDFSKGRRGMAKAVRGAKKFVRSRVRFHENAATRNLLD